MGRIFIVLVVLLIGNTTYFYSDYVHFSLAIFSALRTIAPVSFGVYVLMSLPNLQRKVTTKAQVFATNRHTNPPSTRVSLPTDTAEHAPNFLSPSTAEPSEVTQLVQEKTVFINTLYLYMHTCTHNEKHNLLKIIITRQ